MSSRPHTRNRAGLTATRAAAHSSQEDSMSGPTRPNRGPAPGCHALALATRPTWLRPVRGTLDIFLNQSPVLASQQQIGRQYGVLGRKDSSTQFTPKAV